MMKFVAVLFALVLGSATAQTSPPSGVTAMPDGAGKTIVQKKCAMCHALSVVTTKRASRSEWDQAVNQMVSRGADLSDDEIDTVVEYLSKNYGPLDQKGTPSANGDQPASTDAAAPQADAAGSTPVNVNKASAQDLESSLGLAKPEAEAIVKYREQNGNFKSWQEVAGVPGVPAAKIEGTQKRIVFQ
jgi:competence ComEA-like helix-hairpin-helix protein